jgi:GH25 family lysozyme M1 (1,4-beta-N-acetylmuramidase)
MKKIFRKIWNIMNDKRLEKPLMIAAPILALILVGMILLPAFRVQPEPEAEAIEDTTPAPVTAEEQAEPLTKDVGAAAPTASPTTSPEQTGKPLVAIRLRGDSVNRDLYVRVLGEDGSPVTGHTFTLDVRFPNGQTYSYDTEDDGSSYYLVRLEPGEYTVSMQECEGFALPEPITCTVRAEAQYAPIEDIDEVADVKDVSEVDQSEVPEETYNAPEETVPEIIEVPDPEEPAEEEVPVLDETGEPVYRYEFVLSANGYLILRETGEESNVFPVDEDGDEIPDYGLYLQEQESVVDPDDPDAEEQTPVYVSVALYQADGKPVDTYEYVQIPVTETVEKKIGWQTIDGNDYFLYEDGSKAVGLKEIGGKLYYFNEFGVKARAVGIDVSFYNQDINWQMVKAQGVEFAIIRVGGRGWSTGVLYDDCRTQEYLRGARAAGIKIGVYFYSTAINPYEAVEEASVALNRVGGIPLDYPIFIDMEFSGEYPDGRADQLSANERTEIAIAFCETIQNSGYHAGIYASQNYWKRDINYGALSGYTIWLASYTAEDKLPNFSQRYDIWQFTDSARIKGINGYVDMNVIF